MTAEREDGTAGALGRLRTSLAEREKATDVLKAAFIQGRLTKEEFDLRVGQVFASRTYAELNMVTADIPDGVLSAWPPAGHVDEPGKVLSFKVAARLGAVGAVPSMASATVVLMQQSTGVPTVFGVLLVGLTGVVVAGLLTALLMLLSWVARRSQSEAGQGPPSGPSSPRTKRHEPFRQLPLPRHDPRGIAETARRRLARLGPSPVYCRRGMLAPNFC